MSVGVRRRHTGDDRRSDPALLAAAANDPEAFGAFYHRHFITILHYFWSRTRDRAAASDLAAETFAAALQGIERYDPGRGTPSQWLYGIAGNQLKKFWRRNQASERARTRLQIQTPPVATTGWEEIEAADARLDAARITAALGRLPASYRDAVRLRVVEQQGYDEIGHQLACTPGAARVRVLRGLRRLAVEFDAGQGDGTGR